jgi:hypothetical protein
MLPERLTRILSPDTAHTWEVLAEIVPSTAYLAGGTAVAVHLGHRESRDLDFFYHDHSVDLDALESEIRKRRNLAVTERAPGTLNAVFSKTKIQFLHADEVSPQYVLDNLEDIAGIMVAGMSDLLAMKLKVVPDRGELRDYCDLMYIETVADRFVEEGLSLFLSRYRPHNPKEALSRIVRALGYFDDVAEDKRLPVSKEVIIEYWVRRQPQIIQALEAF